jgi:hypothetical protein
MCEPPRSPSAYATLRGPVADSDERLQRLDPEDWVVRGDRLERLDGLTPVDGDVWAASRHAPDVLSDHRRPILHRHLDERDRTRPTSPQGGATSRGTNVPDPVALAEHRDDIPLPPTSAVPRGNRITVPVRRPPISSVTQRLGRRLRRNAMSRNARTVGPVRCRALRRTSPAACRTVACAQKNISRVGALSAGQVGRSLRAGVANTPRVLRLAIGVPGSGDGRRNCWAP